MQVSVVLVTRGDVEIGPIVDLLPKDDVVIRKGVGGVWERYEAAMSAKYDVIYTQDDDCIIDDEQVIAAYEPGRVTCNMPLAKRAEYPDGVALVGWGAVFHRAATGVFDRYRKLFADDALFRREADRVFTGLNTCRLIDVPFSHLPQAFNANRMGAQAEHLASLAAIRERIYACR